MSGRSVFPGDLAPPIHRLVTGPFQENTYLVADPESGSAVFIDPGDEARRLIRFADGKHLTPVAILATHAHLDHVGAVAELRDHYRIPFYLHRLEKPVLDTLPEAGRMFGLPPRPVPEVDHWFRSDTELQLGNLHWEVWPVPGHSPGGVCFRLGAHVFTGDTLFRGSVGRTDLPGGDWPALERSLVRLLETLNPADVIHSGHGPETDLTTEMHTNPFLFSLLKQLNLNHESN